MREKLKEGVVRAAQYAGLNAAFRNWQSKRLLILCYHEVVPDELESDPLIGDTGIGVSEFSRQMAEVTRVFNPIAPSQLRDWYAGKGGVPRNPVLVTFDDGYRNNLTHAAPVLHKYGVPALVHVCTGYMGKNRILWPSEIFWRVYSWPKRVIPLPDARRETRLPSDPSKRLGLAAEIRELSKHLREERRTAYLNQLREYDVPQPREEICSFLSWSEARQLKNWGIEIGSHSDEHPILGRIDQGRLESELKESKRIIEQETGRECAHLAYPNGEPGDISPAVIEEAGRAGYSFAFMVTDRLASQDNHAFMLDRVHVQGDITLADFRSRISGLHGVLKRSLYTVARSQRAVETARSARALPAKPGLRDEIERKCSTNVV